MSRDKLSTDSIKNANRNVAEFSGHDEAVGAAGYREDSVGGDDCDYMSGAGQTRAISPRDLGFGKIYAGLSWDNIVTEEAGFFKKLLKKAKRQGVDIDLGCLYELKNGKRGALQPFGDLLGSYQGEPYIKLSGDERTGDAGGDDEQMRINGAKWNEIERVLIYCYIYNGPTLWRQIKPQLTIKMEGERPIKITPSVSRNDLNICAMLTLQNENGGIHFTNHSEYFHGHPDMDRAFGYGIEWQDGAKD
jgi:tellurite resistance protein TerA